MPVVNALYTEQLHGQLNALINCIAEQTTISIPGTKTRAEVTTTAINEPDTGCTLLFMISVDRRSMLQLSNYIQHWSLHLHRTRRSLYIDNTGTVMQIAATGW